MISYEKTSGCLTTVLQAVNNLLGTILVRPTIRRCVSAIPLPLYLIELLQLKLL